MVLATGMTAGTGLCGDGNQATRRSPPAGLGGYLERLPAAAANGLADCGMQPSLRRISTLPALVHLNA